MTAAHKTTCPKAALASKVGRDVLGNRTNLAEASAKGASVNKAEAESFASNVLPIIASIRATGITSHRGIAAELNARHVATARGGEWSAVQAGRIVSRDAALGAWLLLPLILPLT